MTGSSLIIDCDECVMQGTETCRDCIVTYLCEDAHDGGLVIDAAEARAVRMLTRAGLSPALRHRRVG
jgi:hypothetical protein